MSNEPIPLWRGRPKLKVPTGKTQRMLVILGWVAVALSLAGTCLAIQHLPDTIPTHFNAAGAADGYGSKWTLLLLPGITCMLNLILGLVSLLPAWYYNYPVPITLDNAERQYRLANTFLSAISALLIGLLLLLNASIIYATFRRGINPVIILGVVFGFVAIMLIAGIGYTMKAMKMK